MLKVDTRRPLDPAETAIGVRDNELRFVFNKFSPAPFQVTFKNLRAELQERNYALSKNGDLLTIVFRKAEAKRWGGLFSNNEIEGNIVSFTQEKSKANPRAISKSPAPRNVQPDPRTKPNNIAIYDGTKKESTADLRGRAKSSNITPNNLSGLDIRNQFDDIDRSFLGFETPPQFKTEQKTRNNNTSINELELKLREVERVNAFKISHDILRRKKAETQKAKVPLFNDKTPALSVLPSKNTKNQRIDPRYQRQFMKNRNFLAKGTTPKKPVKKVEAVSAVQLDQFGNRSFEEFETSSNINFGPQNDLVKINANKKEVLGIFNELKLDVKWINREIDLMSKAKDKSGSFIDFQHKIIKILAIKLKAERKCRFTAEQQFDSLMRKFATQQEFIDRGL